MKVEKKDYSELSVLELINELYELKYKLMYELATAGMADELEGWLADGRMDVDAVTDELMEHIDVLGAMKRVCEEILGRLSEAWASEAVGYTSRFDEDGRTDRASLQRATREVLSAGRN